MPTRRVWSSRMTTGRLFGCITVTEVEWLPMDIMAWGRGRRIGGATERDGVLYRTGRRSLANGKQRLLKSTAVGPNGILPLELPEAASPSMSGRPCPILLGATQLGKGRWRVFSVLGQCAPPLTSCSFPHFAPSFVWQLVSCSHLRASRPSSSAHRQDAVVALASDTTLSHVKECRSCCHKDAATCCDTPN